MSSIRSALVVSLLVFLGSSPAHALDWSLGTHLGVSWIHGGVPGSGTSTIVATPASTFGYQPALRLGCSDRRHAHEVFVDSGQFFIDEAGSTYHQWAGDVGYQEVLWPGRPLSPYANADLGWFNEGGAVMSVTSISYGGGLGVRRTVSERHGAVRAEARLEYLNNARNLGRPALHTVGLRLGFDLWL